MIIDFYHLSITTIVTAIIVLILIFTWIIRRARKIKMNWTIITYYCIKALLLNKDNNINKSEAQEIKQTIEYWQILSDFTHTYY